MLRTNRSILSFIETLYIDPARREHIGLKTFRPGERLLRQGGQNRYVYIVKEGATKCYFNEENGKDFIVEFLGEGEILGEIEAIRNSTCLCNIEALSEVHAYALELPFFRSLWETDTRFNHLLLNELAERIAHTSSRSSFQQLYTVEHGLKKILEFQSRQGISLSKEDMAAYLGVTLRSLNRALKSRESF